MAPILATQNYCLMIKSCWKTLCPAQVTDKYYHSKSLLPLPAWEVLLRLWVDKLKLLAPTFVVVVIGHTEASPYFLGRHSTT
jgi:hypothetical protein